MTLDDGSVIINAQKTIIAKLILTKEVPVIGIVNPNDSFCGSFSLELGFAKASNGKALVDGLTLITRDAGTGHLLSEFAPDHEVRRRSSPRQAQ